MLRYYWSKKQLFWAETLRTVILAILGALLAFIILKPFENKTAYEGEINKKKLELKNEVIHDFLGVSYAYTSEVYDVLKCDSVKEKARCENLKKEINKKYDIYRKEQNRMRVYFEEVEEIGKLIDSQEIILDELKNCFSSPNDMFYSDRDYRKSLKKLNNSTAKCALRSLKMIEEETTMSLWQKIRNWFCRC